MNYEPIDYETMDWEFEAARISRAFGISKSCFDGDKCVSGNLRINTLTSQDTFSGIEASLKVIYRTDGVRLFEISSTSLRLQGDAKTIYTMAQLRLEANGTLESFRSFETNSSALTYILARGLASLGLLTPEIEDVIKPNITDYERSQLFITTHVEGGFDAINWENIDWEAEARRVEMAFEVDVKVGEKCEFVFSTREPIPYYYLRKSGVEKNGENDEFVLLAQTQCSYVRVAYMSFVYYPDAFYFYIGSTMQRSECDFISFHRDGRVSHRLPKGLHPIVYGGLFNLGLLTPEVEKSLSRVHSPNQKKTWETEHKARLAGERQNAIYDSMDWEAEANRIVAAFEVAEPCQFNYYGGTTRCEPTMRTPKEFNEILLLKNGLFVSVEYERRTKHFRVRESEFGTTCSMTINWDGSSPTKRPHTKNTPEHIKLTLTKALFCLDLLTPEIEERLGVSITAHQKTEWIIEYDERLKG